MTATALPTLIETLLADARSATSGHSGTTIRGGSHAILRQTAMALVEGGGLGEHESPGEATLQVLVGRVRLRWGDEALELTAGDLFDIPDARHAVDALTDAVLLLTVAKH